MLAFFDNENPTGRYDLDMSQPVHRSVFERLLNSSIAEGAWRKDTTMQNLRNLIVSGQKVLVTDPTVVKVPRGGSVHLDYLQVILVNPTASWKKARKNV
jgi:hypothetical protein